MMTVTWAIRKRLRVDRMLTNDKAVFDCMQLVKADKVDIKLNHMQNITL